ncbi:MAG: carboxylating nicotinate-nucleotide diphosphorylase [Chlorobium sp.]|nr:carboxylating nicotinate-nucleotide diphosphorylase [Chlorobium sp.]MCW8818896.1 carboxylating nicotinate-nucleotide diphosphorylase [Ignavibacteriaceae bacterium]
MKERDFHDFFAMCRMRAVMQALEEDRYDGDVTTLATIDPLQTGYGVIRAKTDGVVAGIAVADQVFRAIDRDIVVNPSVCDGAQVSEGDIVLEGEGKIASLLVAERTVLNFMQRMSGIATRTRSFVERVSHTGAKILDTRKTAPGLRYFDKEAVKIGGGKNHRYGLFDLVLIKDNHIDASGGVVPAVGRARKYLAEKGMAMKIEVEVRSFEELQQAIGAGPDIILLDNFNVDELAVAVSFARQHAQEILLEASGNVGLRNVAEIAGTGVDYISVGELTHSVSALDLSMTIRFK